MATNTDLSDVFFSQSVSSLNNKKIGVGSDAFSSQYASQMYDPELTKPTGYDVPEITENKQDIDVPGGSDPLSTDLSDAVMLFTDEEKEAERKRLGTSVTGVDAQLNALGPFGSTVSKIASEFDTSQGISIGSVPPVPSYRSSSTTDAGTIDEIDDSGEMREPGIGIGDIRDAYNSGESVYNQMFGSEPAYTGQNTITTSPSSAYGTYAGAGVDLANYSKAFATGLGTTAAQSSIGLSSAPPASLAGAASLSNAATAGTGYLANMGSVGYGATVGAGAGGAAATAGSSWSGALKVGSQLLQIYSIKQAFNSGTAEGKVSGTLQTAALLNPALAPYVALYEGIKMLTGWSGFGGKEKRKEPMGGVEFRVTSQDILDKNNGVPSDSDQTAWLNAGTPEFDEAVKNDTLRLTAPYSWGYNGYDPSHVQGQAQKQIDYLYAFADRYNVDINEETFIKAATGSGGFEKYKPTGDRAPGTNHSLLERIDSVGNGSSTANQWLREVFEYVGPNGEKIVSGTPSSNNINVVTGLKDGFASQQDFENDITEFSNNFYS